MTSENLSSLLCKMNILHYVITNSKFHEKVLCGRDLEISQTYVLFIFHILLLVNTEQIC